MGKRCVSILCANITAGSEVVWYSKRVRGNTKTLSVSSSYSSTFSCLFVCLSVCQAFVFSVFSIRPLLNCSPCSIHLYPLNVYQPTCLFVWLAVDLSFCLSICLLVCLSYSLAVPYTSPSVGLSLGFSVRLPVCLELGSRVIFFLCIKLGVFEGMAAEYCPCLSVCLLLVLHYPSVSHPFTFPSLSVCCVPVTTLFSPFGLSLVSPLSVYQSVFHAAVLLYIIVCPFVCVPAPSAVGALPVMGGLAGFHHFLLLRHECLRQREETI